jgi:hypothetical protein
MFSYPSLQPWVDLETVDTKRGDTEQEPPNLCTVMLSLRNFDDRGRQILNRWLLTL